jgi:RHS repeat-associated protein
MQTKNLISVKSTISGQQGATRSLRYPVLLLTLLVTLLLPTVAFAQGKSGVSPQVISLPSGPGSLEGLGETFEPNLSTGTASYPVKFTAAPGRLGFQPEISLNYDGGNSNGPWGMGWKLSVPSIQRRTENGLPSYVDSEDQFIYSSGEKLIPLSNGTYRFENESSFMRFRRLENGGWEAHTPDGIRYVFGETGQARVANERGTFRWELERVIDTHGNEMRYLYLHDGGYAFLREIRYNFGQNPEGDEVHNAVIFNYEPRPDTYTDRRSGYSVRVGLRGTDIQLWALGKLVRAYQFTYEPERSTGVYSLLIGVVQVGDDGESPLPPHTFTYTQFDATAHRVVTMQNPPPVGLTNLDADLVDINADGLPDLVFTPENGEHRFYLNRGNGRWQQEPVIPAVSPAERLSNPNVRMADMDGDGRVDLLVKAGDTPGSPFYYYTNKLDGEWERDSRVDFGPAPAFNLNDPDVQLIDVNNDHRIDVVLTAGGRMKIWLAREEAWSATADFDVPAPAAGDSARFSDPNIKVGDMTGDRMQDLIFVRDGLVVVWPHNGNGSYDEGEVILNPPTGVGDQDVQILMGDLNNDGLVDLVLPGNRVVHYWLSLGDGGLTDAFIIENTPAYDAQNTAVRLADIDGDGAVELVYSRYPAPENEVMQYVDFSIGAQPFLLASVDNGRGRTIQIEYKSSVADHIADWDAGNPWQINLPFPVSVVSRVTVHDANSGDDYTVDYHYRDGYYDGVQMEFRGFARSEEIKRGDDTAATTVTRLHYDIGRTDESRKGLLLESEVLAEGGRCSGDYQGCYQRTVNQLTTRYLFDEGEERRVGYSYISQTDSYSHEQQAQPVQTRQTFAQDEYGNVIREFDYGMVCGEDLACGNDEILAYIEYAYDEPLWLMNRPQRVYKTDAAGTIVSDVQFYYDGEAFVGLPLGQVTRGDLTRQMASLGLRAIPVKRQRFDQYGNVTGMMDGNGNLRTVEFDALMHTYPVVERLHLGDGKTLSYAATYHYGFGKVSGATDYNGHPHIFTYDTFGHLTRIVQPGDTLAQPTQEFSYSIGNPLSSITTKQRVRSGSDEVVTSVEYFDGLGRKLQTRRQAEDGKVLVEEAVRFNARGTVSHVYLPYFDTTLDYRPPDPSLPHAVQYFDPLGRSDRGINPDGTFTRVEHRPLAKLVYNEEDNRPDSPFANTPTRFTYDGLGRTLSVEEVNVTNGETERYVTRYTYDTLGNLTQMVDAQGNVKTMAYDALGRKVRMVDPDKGEARYTYDDANNLIRMEDAKGQITHYTYDAANRRLTERWSFADGRPDVVHAVYHYDADLSPLHPDARNTMGQVAYIEDREGAAYFSYDPRGNIIGNARRFKTEGLTFVTRAEYDAMDRPIRMIYPDGSAVAYEYNERGLLASVPGFVDEVRYTATGMRALIRYANGAETTYGYDARLRLANQQSRRGQTVLQDLTYGFDGVSNVVSITDARPDRTPVNDQTQSYSYDALGRLLAVAGAYGQIEYGYDSIGNLVRKTSNADPRLNLGEMRYGENGAGPRALTFANGVTYRYDANGNLTQKGNTSYEWDPRNQLLAVDDGTVRSTYAYDAEGTRIRQTVREGDVVTTTLYSHVNVELRGNELTFHVFDDEDRMAHITLPLQGATLLRSFSDIGTSGALAAVTTATERRWYIGDHLKGTSLMLDETGQVVAEVGYYPYGLTRYESNGGEVYYRFTGKELDASGLYYFATRYYDPATGRFISVDPHYAENPTAGMGDPQLLNIYAYSLNNPLKFVDPSGQSPEEANHTENAKKAADAAISGYSSSLNMGAPDTNATGFGTGVGGGYAIIKGGATLLDSKADVVERTSGGLNVVNGLATVGEYALSNAGSGVGASRLAAAGLGATAMVSGIAITYIDMISAPGRAMYEAKQELRAKGTQEGYAVGAMAGMLGLDLKSTAALYGYQGTAPNKYARERMQGFNNGLVAGWKKVASATQEQKQGALRRIAEQIPDNVKASAHLRYKDDADFAVYEGARVLQRNYGEHLKKK